MKMNETPFPLYTIYFAIKENPTFKLNLCQLVFVLSKKKYIYLLINNKIIIEINIGYLTVREYIIHICITFFFYMVFYSCKISHIIG